MLEAVRKSCDSLDIEFVVAPHWYVTAWINAHKEGRNWLRGQDRNNDLCHALLSACLQRHRKQREAA